MKSDDSKISLFECPLNYSLQDENNIVTSSGEAKATLNSNYLTVVPNIGESIVFSYIDILGIAEEDYKINLFLTSKEKLTLFHLGYRYEDFLRAIFRRRNELFLKYLLMDERLRESDIEAEFALFNENAEELHGGSCELRLYETALLILPQKGEPTRIPFSDIVDAREEDYRFIIELEKGNKLVLSQMGEKFDFFRRSLSKAMNELSFKVQSLVKELLPVADPTKTKKLAFLLREGRAAKRADIASISPEFWEILEARLEASGSKEEYNYLKNLSQDGQICIGIKRGLMADLTGDYIWFLIPIYSTNSMQAGNAIAMEAISEGDTGRATYFFRMLSRRDYPHYNNLDHLHREFDAFIRKINRCMIEINFRREPIYLTEKRLTDPQYERYRFAIQRLPSLQDLRNHFIGRVIHTSPEQWKKDVMDLLKFNVSIGEDSMKWMKGLV